MYIFNSGHGKLVGLRVVGKYDVYGLNGSKVHRGDSILVEFYDVQIHSDSNPAGVRGKFITRSTLDELCSLPTKMGDGVALGDGLGTIDICASKFTEALVFARVTADMIESTQPQFVIDCLESARTLNADPFAMVQIVHNALKSAEMNQALSLDGADGGGTDYILKPSAKSCWITVDGFALHITQDNDSVVVGVTKLGEEHFDPIYSLRIQKSDL